MKSGLEHSVAFFEGVVEDHMCASLDGKDIHPVYSTFWLSYHAEIAARRAIEEFFDEGENAVGAELCLRHEAMCAVGDTVRIEAKVTEVSGAKIVCTITARASAGIIARGHQTQIVLQQKRIDDLVQKAYDSKAQASA